MAFYIFHRHRVCLVDRVGLICSLYSWWEGFGSSFLATLPLGFDCGFISTSACGSSTGVCSWGCPGGPGFAPVRARGGGGAAAWVAGALAAAGTHRGWCLGQQEIQCSRGYGSQYWPIRSSILVWRTPLPDREAWQATIHRAAESRTLTKWPCAHRCKDFFLPIAALPQWALSKKVAQLLGLRGPRWSQVFRGSDCLRWRSYGPIKVFFPASCSWQSESLFGQSFSIDLPIQAHRGAPLAGVLFCGSGHQALKGAPGWGPALQFSASGIWWASVSIVHCPCWLVWGERLWWWLHPLCMTQQYHLASMAAQLSSTGISHLDLLPHIPSVHLSTINRSPHPGIALQSPNSSSQPLHLPWDLRPCLAAARAVWLSFHLGCHRSAVSLSALNVSPLTQTIVPMWGWIPASVLPPTEGRSSPTNTPAFLLVPSSYRVLHGSVYSFPLAWDSCPLSAGVLHALLCLNVYSWCIHGERCPPTTPPSCSPLNFSF